MNDDRNDADNTDNTKKADKFIADRLIQARIAAGFPSAMGAAKYFNWKPSTYASHENRSAAIRPFWAELYGKAFRVDPMWILSGEGQGPVSQEDKWRKAKATDENLFPIVERFSKYATLKSLARSKTTNTNPVPPPLSAAFVRAGRGTMMNVYGWKWKRDPHDEHVSEMVTDFTKVTDAINAPPNLVGVEGAYAALVADNSMAPRVRPGDTIFVNPMKPPRPGDLVIVYLRDEGVGILRELVGYTKMDFDGFEVRDANGNTRDYALDGCDFHRVVGVLFD